MIFVGKELVNDTHLENDNLEIPSHENFIIRGYRNDLFSTLIFDQPSTNVTIDEVRF